ncbi:MAG: phosphoesterase, partial [Actinomycetia bacterium]|nr:phosphoesterase [Actinomycetes bacterium]
FFSECTSASAVAHMDFGDGGAGSSLGRHTCSAGFAGDNPTSFVFKNGTAGGCTSKLTANWVDVNGHKSMQRVCVPFADQVLLDGTSTPVPYETNLLSQLRAAGTSVQEYASSSGWDTCRYFSECISTAGAVVKPVQLLSDASAGTLPTYSLVLPNGPGAKTSQHNGASMIEGDNWMGKAISAIENGPDWGHVAIIVTYDDCGCFYDHVPPPAATGWGLRMPMVIVSPYARPSWTDHTPGSFASIVHFIDNVAGVAPLNSRVAGAYDLSGSFDLTQTPITPAPLHRAAVPRSTVRYLKTHDPSSAQYLDPFEAAADAGG